MMEDIEVNTIKEEKRKLLQMFLIVLIKDIFVRLTQVIHSDSQPLITRQILL